MLKIRIKIIVDILMLSLFLYLAGYHPGAGLYMHACIGITVYVLFLLHHLLNMKWFSVLFKGSYQFPRLILTIVDGMLLIVMLEMMASSLMISSLVFPTVELPVRSHWRDIHAAATVWGFLLMAILSTPL